MLTINNFIPKINIPNIAQSNYRQSVQFDKNRYPNLAPLKYDTVSFGQTEKTAGDERFGIYFKEAEKIHNDANESGKYLKFKLNKIFKDMIISDKNPNGIMHEPVCRIKSPKSIREKSATRRWINSDEVKSHMTDIVGARIILKNSSIENVYKVIVKRFLAIFYPPAEFNKISATISVENEQFGANGKVCTNLGYLEVLKDRKDVESVDNGASKQEDSGDSSNLDILNALKKGEEINTINFETKTSETTPPSRYNSGSMILAMENAGKLIEDEELREQIKGAGIGTSATRAEIMKKLERIGYIAVNTKTQIITPTKKGEAIYDVVNLSMPDMLNPKLTASW